MATVNFPGKGVWGTFILKLGQIGKVQLRKRELCQGCLSISSSVPQTALEGYCAHDKAQPRWLHCTSSLCSYWAMGHPWHMEVGGRLGNRKHPDCITSLVICRSSAFCDSVTNFRAPTPSLDFSIQDPARMLWPMLGCLCNSNITTSVHFLSKCPNCMCSGFPWNRWLHKGAEVLLYSGWRPDLCQLRHKIR